MSDRNHVEPYPPQTEEEAREQQARYLADALRILERQALRLQDQIALLVSCVRDARWAGADALGEQAYFED